MARALGSISRKCGVSELMKVGGDSRIFRNPSLPRLHQHPPCMGTVAAMSSNSTGAANPNMRAAWVIVALLAPVALLNYMDRQMLAAMKFSVMHDIPDIGSEANWGRMLGQFKWVYALLSPIGGF